METQAIEDLTKVFVRASDDVLFQVVDNEVVLLSLNSGEYFGLNEVGARIWVTSSKGRSLAGILEDVIEHYDVVEPELIRDVMPFIDTLEKEGLVTLVTED